MVDKYKLSGGEPAGKRNRFQGITGREHIIRNAGNTETNAGKIHQKIVAVKLNLRQQVQSLRGKCLMKVFTGRTFAGQHQNRVFKQDIRLEGSIT